MMSLDSLDSKIIQLLDANSRQPYARLAKQLSVPQETVRYRVQSLLRDGVIQNLQTVIDGGKLGFYYYKIFFKFYNVNETAVEMVTRYLCEHEAVNWVVRVDGTYDISITVRVSNPIELSNLIDEVRRRYSTQIHRWVYSVNIRMEFLTRDYLSGAKKKRSAGGSYSAYEEAYRLDKTNWEIVRRLASDSRASAVDIAKGLAISSDAVLLRIKQLERDQVIVRYGLVLDNAKLSQLNYYVLIYLSYFSPKREQAFVEHCRKKPNIVYLIRALGEWDYELSIEVKTIQEYRELMMDLTREFSDIIRDYNAMMVSKIHKYIYP